MSIPKIIHQIWIGPKPAPIKLMNTWKEKNPDFEYIFWNEDEFEKRQMFFKCQSKIDEMEEYCGKTDIMRWEILYKYGGIYIDADSICIEPLDDYFLIGKKGFASWESEIKRPGLIAVGTMGFYPKHPLVKEAINWIKKNDVSIAKTGKMAWELTGPTLLTNIYNSDQEKYNKIFTILPSYTFLPSHFTGTEYNGHGKVYAYQAWGSTKDSYNNMNNIEIPVIYTKPPIENSVSILIPSYNTKSIYVKECLESIKQQVGWFNIEIVWIDDGSNDLNLTILKKLLENYEKSSRFTTVKFVKNETNMGIGYTLNLGVTLCSNELILRMDSDDMMIYNRIHKQVEYMITNQDVKMCCSQIVIFINNDVNKIINITRHPSITWDDFVKNKPHWFVNHPTYCFRKSAVLEMGNYNKDLRKMMDDYDFSVRMLKKYKYIHNISEPLVYYRSHESQVTQVDGIKDQEYWKKKREDFIKEMIEN